MVKLMASFHIIPTEDLIEHLPNDCPCKPLKKVAVDNKTGNPTEHFDVVHNVMDGKNHQWVIARVD